jgi:hypothetical protein
LIEAIKPLRPAKPAELIPLAPSISRTLNGAVKKFD